MKDSPLKKLDFGVDNKENLPATAESITTPDLEILKKPVEDVKETAVVPSAPKTIKELEAEEPILKENPHRFVLFPLQYHEIVSANASFFHPTLPLHIYPTYTNTYSLIFTVEHVQASRSFFLDCRRGRPVQRSSRLAQPPER